MKRTAQTVALVAMLMLSLGYAGRAGADDGGTFNCCGNKGSEEVQRCRYTDRGTQCGINESCPSSGDYTYCCQDGCTTTPGLD
jgi:hypothetical protein